MFDLENLNPEQREAVAHNDGPLLILAGAGSGKTRVLVSRVARLLSQGAQQPPGICVLTFTNKSAKELKHRVKEQIGGKTKSLWAGTFHSFGLQILRKYHKALGLNPKFHVADSSDCQAIVKELLINIANTGKNSFQVDKLLEIVQTYKNHPHKIVVADEDYLAVAKVLLPKYESRKKTLGVVDFEDLLSLPIELFERHPDILHKVQLLFQYYMVDEFQDTNDTQMKLLEALVEPQQNLVVVGDDDQAIYGWRGAQVKNILDFPKRFQNCKVIQLNRNYRSSAKILDLANNVITNNKDRHGKVLKAQVEVHEDRLPEAFVYETDEEEIEQVAKLIDEFHQQGRAYNDIAVLYRSNGQGGFLETELRQSRIPYNLSGGTAFFDRKEVKDMLAYLVCLSMPKELSLRRILNVPQRGVGDETVSKIEEFIEESKDDISFMQALRMASTGDFVAEGPRQGIVKFLEDLSKLKTEFSNNPEQDWEQALVRFFYDIGYRKYLGKFCKNDEALKRRWTSVEIFARVFQSFMSRKRDKKKALREFVDMMSLRDYESDLEGPVKDEVHLMTMHAAKGLEFPVVIIIGVEEDLIPHQTLGSDISEERRLFYVGVTRAKEHLVMTYTRMRKRYGKLREVVPSRFLAEVDKSFYQLHSSGYRPVSVNQKEALLESLQAKLAASMEQQKIK